MNKDMSMKRAPYVSRLARVLAAGGDPAGAARRLGRQHDVARALGVSDKRVATWRTRRAVNGFPEPVACNIGPTRAGGKRRHLLWDIGECEAWFERYSERDQRARRGPYQRQEST